MTTHSLQGYPLVALALWVAPHPIAHAVACILQEGQMDEKELAEKLMAMKTHMSTMVYTIENFQKTMQRLNAILGGK